MTTPTLDTQLAEPQPRQLDDELIAIQTVLGALSALKGEARQRVIDYVFQRLGLSASAPAASDVIVPLPLPNTTPAVGGQSQTPIRDIRSLKDQKSPRTAVEMAALVAYYLTELAPEGSRKSEIGTEDITTYFKQAGFPLPATPRQTLFNAKAAGYLDSAAQGAYKLNPVGHNLVAHSLPASNSDGSSKPRAKRSAKKTAKNTRK